MRGSSVVPCSSQPLPIPLALRSTKTSMFYRTEDLRLKWIKVVLPPIFLEEELPATERASATVYNARAEICKILSGADDRLFVVVGPCSIHDTKAAREYAGLLKEAIDEYS